VRFAWCVGLKDEVGLVGVGVGTLGVADIVTVTDLNEQDREDAVAGKGVLRGAEELNDGVGTAIVVVAASSVICREKSRCGGTVYVPEGKYAKPFPTMNLLYGVPVGRLGTKRNKPVLNWIDGDRWRELFV
jgi:hypothetical protein